MDEKTRKQIEMCISYLQEKADVNAGQGVMIKRDEKADTYLSRSGAYQDAANYLKKKFRIKEKVRV